MERSIRAVCLEVDQVLIGPADTGLLPGIPMTLGWCGRDSIPLLMLTDQSALVRRGLTDLPDQSSVTAISTKLTAVAMQILVHAPLAAILISTWPGYTTTDDQAAWDRRADQVAAALPAALANIGNRATRIEASGDPLWKKPEPGLLERAAMLLECDSTELLLVGATQADRETAHAIGAGFLDAEAWRNRAAPWPPW